MKRFHLSTLLLLTVLAGAFVGVNTIPRAVYPNSNDAPILYYGWPLTFADNMVELSDEDYERLRMRFNGFPPQMPRTGGYGMRPLAANITIGLIALALAGYVSEKIARRKRAD